MSFVHLSLWAGLFHSIFPRFSPVLFLHLCPTPPTHSVFLFLGKSLFFLFCQQWCCLPFSASRAPTPLPLTPHSSVFLTALLCGRVGRPARRLDVSAATADTLLGCDVVGVLPKCLCVCIVRRGGVRSGGGGCEQGGRWSKLWANEVWQAPEEGWVAGGDSKEGGLDLSGR